MYRLSKLIQSDRKLFHTNDLAVLWGISNRHNLYMTISRYMAKGTLFPVYKGLYSTVPVSNLDPLELGPAIIHGFCYMTTESVLAKEGIISQAIYAHTFVAGKSSRVSVDGKDFRFRKLKDDYLFNPAGIISQGGVYVASTERAAADLLYFDPKYHFDVSSNIDFEKVRLMQKEIGYI